MDKSIFTHSMYVTKDLIELVTNEKSKQDNAKVARKVIILRIFFAPAGIVMLFWSYTFLLGLVILISILMAILKKPISKWWTTTKNWGSLKYRYKTTFSFSKTGVRIKSIHVDLKYTWHFLVSYFIAQDWLVVIADGSQYLFFPIEAMKQKGVYEEVIDLLKEHKDMRQLTSGSS